MAKHKPGKYIVASSSGLTVRSEFYKMNAILVLSDKELAYSEIEQHLANGYLRFMGPESHTAKHETLESEPVSEVKAAPKKPQEKNEKEKGAQNVRS